MASKKPASELDLEQFRPQAVAQAAPEPALDLEGFRPADAPARTAPTDNRSIVDRVKERLGRGLDEAARAGRESGGTPVGYVRALARGTSEALFGEGAGAAVDKAAEQGLSAGFGDEARGFVAGAKNLLLPPSAGGGQSVSDALPAYRAERDADRAEQDRLKAQHPGLYTATEIAASVALPSPAGAVKAVGLGGRLKQAGVAAAEAGAIGLGSSTADLTEGDIKGAAKDTAAAAGLGAAGNIAGQAVGKGVSTVKNAVVSKLTGSKDDLVDRILNEIATGPTDLKTTPTKAKLVDKARDAIESEVVGGPDAKKVRDAFLSEAKEGRAQLAPILSDVNTVIRAGYEDIAKAGRAGVEPATYTARLEEAIKEAAQNGDAQRASVLKGVNERFQTMLADATSPEPAILQRKVEEIRAKAAEALKAGDANGAAELEELAKLTEKVADEKTWRPDLETIRRFTTRAQEEAASAIGGLNLHLSARLKNEASAVTSKIMSDFLDAAVKGDEKLEKVASTIRRNNERYHALKTIDDALSLRQWKENTVDTPLTRAAKAVAPGVGQGVGTGVVAGVLTGDDPMERATNATIGAVGLGAAAAVTRKALPSAARALDRKLTTAALDEIVKTAGPARAEAVERARRAGVSEKVIRAILAARKPDQAEDRP